MAYQIYLSNDTSEVDGYKVAYIGFRSPNASSTVSTAVTGTTAGGTDVAMTATSGGTAVKWITAPFKEDVTITNRVVSNIWGFESNAAANAQFGIHLHEYTTSLQSAFMNTTFGTEATVTTAHLDQWSRPSATDDSGNYTATTIDAGNRLAILPYLSNVGTMAAGHAVTMNYNGATAGADGDTWIQLTESVLAGSTQFGDGTSSPIPGGPSIAGLEQEIQWNDPVIKAAMSPDAPWVVVKNEYQYMEEVQTA